MKIARMNQRAQDPPGQHPALKCCWDSAIGEYGFWQRWRDYARIGHGGNVALADCTGEAHVFHFRTRLFGPGVALDAFELRDGHPAGYQFQIIGDPQGDLLVLLGRLIEKIRRALSIRHVKDGELGLQIADHQVVQGRIEWDAVQDGRVPLLVVDGREITWEEFGRMMLTCEGWQFRLEIRDKSEEF